MADQDETGSESARHQVPSARPATPSDKAERPEGLAFDVEPGADLTGVPAGEQVPEHPGAARIDRTVRESGEGVGLAVPGGQDSPDNYSGKHGLFQAARVAHAAQVRTRGIRP
jgi:hypothetical protein